LEDKAAWWLKNSKIPSHESEYKFSQDRKFRFDIAWPKYKIAVELEGGVWTGGRHTRGMGFINDLEKYNLAVKLGWRVLRYTGENLHKIPEDVKILLEMNTM
jgi:very-short-patch-repair endonuclease